MAARLTAEFLKDWKSEVNPDLQKERDTCTFNTNELTHIIDGGPERTKRRKEFENLFFTKYVDIFSFKKRPFCTRSELYERSVAKSVKLFELRREHGWTEEDFEMAQCVLNYDFSLSLHHTMFIPALERLATDEQKAKWLPLAQNYNIIGTYAQTEMGHGTNLLALETVANYDHSTDEFVMNTPKLTSMKWWPGGLGKSCTHALVLAQLVIDGEKNGMHPFMVQLRSLDEHMPMPGISVGDIGSKIGANNVDNGYLILNNVRIPRENMLMKNNKVTRQGKFVQLSGNKANYATMILVRVKIVRWAHECLRHGACVAIRYSAVRRQTSLKLGGPEQQILDFQTQQYKTFPAVSTSYAAFFVAEEMLKLYNLCHAEIMKGNTKRLAELHAQSSGLKAYLTDKATAIIETCRRSCGGHGFLMSSGIAENASSSLALVTVEGENTVLYLQTARYLMKQMANAVSGTKAEGSTAYMNRDFSAYICPIEFKTDCHNLDKLVEVYKQRAQRVVMTVAQKLQIDMESGLPQEQVFNNNMVGLVRAAKAHIHLSVVDTFVQSLVNLQSTISAQLHKVLKDLCAYFTLNGMVEECADFLEMETMGLSQIEWIRQEELNLLAALRPNIVGLVDAFDLHDETVASVLGQYDGNAYQHLFESTQFEPMNQTEVHPAYYKHMKGLLTKFGKAKL